MRVSVAWHIVALSAVLLVFTRTVPADKIKLVSGELLQGRIVESEGDSLRVDPISGERKAVSLSEIQSIMPGPVRPTGPLKVKYVRVDVPGEGKYLHLRELQVFVGDQDVTRQAKARQSTTFTWEGRVHPAELAIDGSFDTINHTGDSHPWLDLELDQEVTPTRIVLHNRTDQNLQSRLNGCRLLLFNEKWELQWARTTVNAGDMLEFSIPQMGEAIEPEVVAEIESYRGRPGPIDAPLLTEPRDFVWVEDAVPAGAKVWDTWTFDQQQTAYSGVRSIRKENEGTAQSLLVEATYQLRVGEGDKFFAMVYLDPAKPPRCVMLQFHDGVNWEHRAYWGEDAIDWGSGENAAHHRVGDLPPTGKWIRLEVDAASVGCPPGMRINGWSCSQHGGIAWWDHLGLVTRTPQDEPQPRFVAEDDLEWKLRDGTVFSGTIQEWGEDGVTVDSHLSTVGTVKIPLDHLAEAWSMPVVSGELKVERQPIDPQLDQVYVKTESNVTVIAGTILQLTREGMKIHFEGQDRKLSRAKVAGIVFSTSGTLPASELEMRVKVAGERQFVGKLAQWDRHAVTLRTHCGELIIPHSSIHDVIVNNGRIIDLTEVTPQAVEEVPYFDRHWKYQVNQSLTGRPLQVGQTTFTRGLSMHSRSVLTYEIPDAFHQFKAKLGLQHLEGDLGNVTVRVWGDDKILYEKESLTTVTPLENVAIELNGHRQLRLEVDFGENFDVGDHVVWGDPVFTR